MKQNTNRHKCLQMCIQRLTDIHTQTNIHTHTKNLHAPIAYILTQAYIQGQTLTQPFSHPHLLIQTCMHTYLHTYIQTNIHRYKQTDPKQHAHTQRKQLVYLIIYSPMVCLLFVYSLRILVHLFLTYILTYRVGSLLPSLLSLYLLSYLDLLTHILTYSFSDLWFTHFDLPTLRCVWLRFVLSTCHDKHTDSHTFTHPEIQSNIHEYIDAQCQTQTHAHIQT